MQSGKPVGRVPHAYATRRACSSPTRCSCRRGRRGRTSAISSDRGLTMYGQMTAGSWIYIGTQGILQGTYETLAAAGRRHFGGSLAGRLVVTAGLGGMGGAQPLAATMNGARGARDRSGSGADRAAAGDTGIVDEATASLDDGARRAAASGGRARRRARSASWPTPPTCCRRSSPRGMTPDVLTDQTSAHDALNGYVPNGLSLAGSAGAARARSATTTCARSIAGHGARTCARCWRCGGAAASRSTTATTSARRP